MVEDVGGDYGGEVWEGIEGVVGGYSTGQLES